MKQRKYRGALLGVACCLILNGVGCGNPEGETSQNHQNVNVEGQLEVHFLDVGQGDSTLIKSGNHAMLIDAGENEKGEDVTEYLKSQNVEKLDYIIGTHPDSDHIGGMDVAIHTFDSEKIFMPDLEKDTKTYREVIDSANEKKEEIVEPEVGETYELGEAEFTIVSPVGDDYSNSNNYSIGILLEHGENTFLFVGDAEEESEEEMLEHHVDVDADVYKVSHHGSSTGTSEAFLEEISPDYAVISCGEGNSYGHPHAEVLNELREEGVEVFRTDEQGTIVATSDGKKIEWNLSASENWVSGEPTGSKTQSSEGTESETETSGGEERTYILNTNTKKYHSSDCGSIETMKEKNKEERKTRADVLLKEGYTPCQNCLGD